MRRGKTPVARASYRIRLVTPTSKRQTSFKDLADGEGFEPSVPLWGTHAFQASPFDRSGTHPIAGVITVLGFDSGRKPEDFPMARESQKDAGEYVHWVPADWMPI